MFTQQTAVRGMPGFKTCLGFQPWNRSELAWKNHGLSNGLNLEHLDSDAMNLKKLLGQEVSSQRTSSVQITRDCNWRLRSPHYLWVIGLQGLWSVSGVRQVGKIENFRGRQVNTEIKKARVRSAGFRSQPHSLLIMESRVTY